MRKYEEEHYQYKNIESNIYPWIKNEMRDSHALNGKQMDHRTTAISLVGDLKIVFAVKRGEDIYEVIQDNMLAPEQDVLAMYRKACENLVKDVEFVIGNTWYGAFGIIADGIHEASALCFKHIWQVCVEKLKDDLIIVVPSKDTVLFAPASQEKVVEEMLDHCQKAYDAAADPISLQLFMFSQAEGALKLYEPED